MPRMHHTSDKSILTDPEKLTDFVKSAVLGQLPLYWESEKVPKQKYSLKVVGEDFDKRILSSKKDTLVLIQHPIKEKNRHLLGMFEEFSRIEKGGVTLARMNGINESQSYKNPQKLPALVYFRHNGETDKEIIPFEGINELLLKSAKEHEVHDRLRQFIQTCQRS